MAQDIIDNTRRAFATSSTSPTGYGSEGPPSGRYIAPASSRDCIVLFPGDCGSAKQFLLLGEAFHRTDMRIKKKFPFGRKASAELDFEVLNVFGDINFNQGISLGGSWQVTSAYTDINTTYDPGGRIGQIVWRVIW
jgi:hypothetical protein